MKIDLPYLYRQKDRYGNYRHYVRRNGRKTRVPGEPGTDDFLQAYRAALEVADRQPAPLIGMAASGASGTLKWLCEHYYVSAEYRSLAQSTQYARRGVLDNICREKGHLPFGRMEVRHVSAMRDAKTGVEAGNAIVKGLRALFKWAKIAGHIEHNPMLQVTRTRVKSNGFHTWTVEEVLRFEECWPLGTRENLALRLLLFTGVRRADVVRLGLGMVCDGDITYRQMKTGVEVTIPIRPELSEALLASPSGHMTYLVTQYGRTFTPAGFGNWFRDKCVEAGVPGRAHGLRKAGATIAVENGATAHQLMAIFGWTTLQQAEHYTRKAERKRLARAGMERLVLDQNKNRSDPQLAGVTDPQTLKRSK